MTEKQAKKRIRIGATLILLGLMILSLLHYGPQKAAYIWMVAGFIWLCVDIAGAIYKAWSSK